MAAGFRFITTVLTKAGGVITSLIKIGAISTMAAFATRVVNVMRNEFVKQFTAVFVT